MSASDSRMGINDNSGCYFLSRNTSAHQSARSTGDIRSGSRRSGISFSSQHMSPSITPSISCSLIDAVAYIRKHGNELNKSARLRLWRAVCQHLNELHSQQPLVIHGSLDPSHILFDDEGRIQIVPAQSRTILSEAIPYTAPELLLRSEHPTEVSDVFSLGCIGLLFCFFQQPYDYCLTGDVFQHIQRGLRPAPESHDLLDPVEVQVYELLQSCWSPIPNMRPSCSDVLRTLDQIIRLASAPLPVDTRRINTYRTQRASPINIPSSYTSKSFTLGRMNDEPSIFGSPLETGFEDLHSPPPIHYLSHRSTSGIEGHGPHSPVPSSSHRRSGGPRRRACSGTSTYQYEASQDDPEMDGMFDFTDN